MTSEELTKLHNQPEYSVADIAGAVKRTIEGAFSRVRVRGEISGFKHAASGHLYLDLKDDKAVLNAVCWKGQALKLAVKPQDGLEVICTGKLTTYPGRSNYQLVIEEMEAAGIGALMALLEALKKQLSAEGLFASERKRPLPYLPLRIGVVTSPTGAVIRDILHRIADRFPCHVMVYPVIVQGKNAEIGIAEAIRSFNRFDGVTTPPRPELLIVARGGGSIEDLWCFNEEIVVRATAESSIPIIAAIGHETDTTLIDFAADRRAPTPTAAAEMAVPVLTDLRYSVNDAHNRLQRSITRFQQHQQNRLEGLARGLINPMQLLEQKMQRLDEWSERLSGALKGRVQQAQQQLNNRAALLSVTLMLRKQQEMRQQLNFLHQRLQRSVPEHLNRHNQKLEKLAQMLMLLSHEHVLKRGFAYVTTPQGALISSKNGAADAMTITFKDGKVAVVKAGSTTLKKKDPASNEGLPSPQGSLL
jgi:exodeoxyribonuclease VII large subunit